MSPWQWNRYAVDQVPVATTWQILDGRRSPQVNTVSGINVTPKTFDSIQVEFNNYGMPPSWWYDGNRTKNEEAAVRIKQLHLRNRI